MQYILNLNIAFLLLGCGIDTSGDHKVDVRDSTHTAEISDSNHTVEGTVKVKTNLDLILEICGVVLPDGTVVPYSEWTSDTRECLNQLERQSPIPGFLN